MAEWAAEHRSGGASKLLAAYVADKGSPISTLCSPSDTGELNDADWLPQFSPVWGELVQIVCEHRSYRRILIVATHSQSHLFCWLETIESCVLSALGGGDGKRGKNQVSALRARFRRRANFLCRGINGCIGKCPLMTQNGHRVCGSAVRSRN
jgi:hypothetical protein